MVRVRLRKRTGRGRVTSITRCNGCGAVIPPNARRVWHAPLYKRPRVYCRVECIPQSLWE
jgi:hypothetical protein